MSNKKKAFEKAVDRLAKKMKIGYSITYLSESKHPVKVKYLDKKVIRE